MCIFVRQEFAQKFEAGKKRDEIMEGMGITQKAFKTLQKASGLTRKLTLRGLTLEEKDRMKQALAGGQAPSKVAEAFQVKAPTVGIHA